MVCIIGQGLYGLMRKGGDGKVQVTIPGRLIVTSKDIEVINATLVSAQPISAIWRDDGLEISYTGDTTFALEFVIL